MGSNSDTTPRGDPGVIKGLKKYILAAGEQADDFRHLLHLYDGFYT